MFRSLFTLLDFYLIYFLFDHFANLIFWLKMLGYIYNNFWVWYCLIMNVEIFIDSPLPRTVKRRNVWLNEIDMFLILKNDWPVKKHCDS